MHVLMHWIVQKYIKQSSKKEQIIVTDTHFPKAEDNGRLEAATPLLHSRDHLVYVNAK